MPAAPPQPNLRINPETIYNVRIVVYRLGVQIHRFHANSIRTYPTPTGAIQEIHIHFNQGGVPLN
jgi:hypothetical protein